MNWSDSWISNWALFGCKNLEVVNQWNSESSCKRSSPVFCTARSTVQFDGHRQSRFCVKCFSQPLRVGFILFWFYHSIIFHHVLSSCVHIRSSNLHIGKMTRRCPMKPIPWPGIGAWASQRRPLHSRIFENASTPLHFVFWPRKSFFHKRFFWQNGIVVILLYAHAFLAAHCSLWAVLL